MTSSSRVGRQELQQLADCLSPRDWQILWLVRRHRFITTRQLQRMVFTAHATQGAATRACTRVLGRLMSWRVLTRLERRIGGSRHGSAAFIWCLDVVGERLTRGPDQPRRRFHEPSFLFLQHTLAIAEVHVQLVEAVMAGWFTVERVLVEAEAWRSSLAPHGGTTLLKPDLMVTLATSQYCDHWYLEIDLATESLPVLLRKCQAYEDYRRTGAAQAEYGVFPRVLWLLPTPQRVAQLSEGIAKQEQLHPRLFVLTTPDALIQTLREPP